MLPKSPEVEHPLHGLKHLGASRVEQEAVELAEAHPARIEKILHGQLEMLPQQLRQLRAQHHAEAVMPDVPAHDLLGVAPEMIPRGKDSPPPTRYRPRALGVWEPAVASPHGPQFFVWTG